MLKWIKANPRRAAAGGAVLLSGAGALTGMGKLQVLSDMLAALAPILGG